MMFLGKERWPRRNVIIYAIIGLLFANKAVRKIWPSDPCEGHRYYESRQPSNDTEKKYLIGRLKALSMGYQLGNQVFEILGFEAIAKMLGREPVIVLDDPFNEAVKPQMWSAITYFPRLFDGYEFWRVPNFKFESYPTSSLHSLYNTVFNLTELLQMDEHKTIAVNASYFENYRYLDLLGKVQVQNRLWFPESAYQFAEDLVPKAFHARRNRLCVHMRRGDYLWNPALFASNSSYTFKAIKNITGFSDNFAVVIFTDDPDYAQDMINSRDYQTLNVVSYLPRSGTKKHQLPKHYNWLFMSRHCTHFLLTAGRSTFAFFGVYLADQTQIKVYYNPYHREKQHYDLPPHWKPIYEF